MRTHDRACGFKVSRDANAACNGYRRAFGEDAPLVAPRPGAPWLLKTLTVPVGAVVLEPAVIEPV